MGKYITINNNEPTIHGENEVDYGANWTADKSKEITSDQKFVLLRVVANFIEYFCNLKGFDTGPHVSVCLHNKKLYVAVNSGWDKSSGKSKGKKGIDARQLAVLTAQVLKNIQTINLNGWVRAPRVARDYESMTDPRIKFGAKVSSEYLSRILAKVKRIVTFGVSSEFKNRVCHGEQRIAYHIYQSYAAGYESYWQVKKKQSKDKQGNDKYKLISIGGTKTPCCQCLQSLTINGKKNSSWRSLFERFSIILSFESVVNSNSYKGKETFQETYDIKPANNQLPEVAYDYWEVGLCREVNRDGKKGLAIPIYHPKPKPKPKPLFV